VASGDPPAERRPDWPDYHFFGKPRARTKAQRKLVIHVRVDGGAHHRITDLDIRHRG
jgi:hypothetical protein